MTEETQLLIDSQEVKKAFVACLWKEEELKTVEMNASGVPEGTIVVEESCTYMDSIPAA